MNRTYTMMLRSAAPRLRPTAAYFSVKAGAVVRRGRRSEADALRAAAGRRRGASPERKDYAANPVKLANNKIFASLAADATARGRVLYLEAEQCNTTAALEEAGVPPGSFHAVTADDVDYAQIRAKHPWLLVDHAELSAVLGAQRAGLRGAWLDYCSEPYGAGDRSPPRDIARAVKLLARSAARGRTAVLAVTAASSRLPPGRIAAIRATLIANGLEDLAPAPRDAAPMEVAPFLAEVVGRAAAAAGVTATEAANVRYKSAGSTGQSMTFVAFRIASE